MADCPLTARQVEALRRLFAAEIESAFDGRLPIRHLPARVARQLVAAGLVEEVQVTLLPTWKSPFAMTVKGHILTPAGHYAYCSWCAENVDPEEDEADAASSPTEDG